MGSAVQLLLNALVSGTGYGLIAVSFALIYNTTHFFNFAHAAVYTASAYAAFVLLSNFHVNPIIAVFGALVCAALLGGFLEALLFNPLRHRRSSPIVLLLASLGTLIAIQNCISIIFGDAVKVLPGLTVRAGYSVAGARITLPQISIILGGLSVSVLTAIALRYTKIGRTIRAVANDKDLSRIVGIGVDKSTFVAFVGGSLLVGIAAVLIAYDTGLRPTMGLNALLFGVVGMIIGGVGRTWAALWGGLLTGFAQQIGGWVLPSKWQDAIVFILLIAFLLFRPQGLFGTPLKKTSV